MGAWRLFAVCTPRWLSPAFPPSYQQRVLLPQESHKLLHQESSTPSHAPLKLGCKTFAARPLDLSKLWAFECRWGRGGGLARGAGGSISKRAPHVVGFQLSELEGLSSSGKDMSRRLLREDIARFSPCFTASLLVATGLICNEASKSSAGRCGRSKWKHKDLVHFSFRLGFMI